MAVLGASGFATVEEYLFIESTTWSPWCDCEALVTVVGGGGSGARGANVNDTYLNACASGGGAGAAAKSKLTLSKSTTYTITAGARGAAIAAGTSGSAGNDGGNSSFAGSDITDMSANGGDAGTFATGNPHVNLSCTGAAGGAAGTTGNLWNTAGGSAGNMTLSFSGPFNHYWNSYGTGGGAVGIFGYTGPSSGNVANTTNTVYQNVTAASGGAGTGAATGTVDPNQGTAHGQGGPGLKGATTANNNNLGQGGTPDNLMAYPPNNRITYHYGDSTIPVYHAGWLSGNYTAHGEAGIGVGGRSSSNNNVYACAGFFAGGGVQIGVQGQDKTGGNAFLGGGGGAYLSHKSTTNCQPGQGGQGFIHIQIIKWNI
jgi:hypothetical protein